MAGTGTLAVTPGTGVTINTLPPSGQDTAAHSLPVVIASDQTPVPTQPQAGEAHIGEVGGNSIVATASFTRPANTTAYAVGQLIANATAAGSVAPLQLTVARKNGGTGRMTRVRVSSSAASDVGAVIRVHAFKTLPTTTAGDGGAFAGAVNGVAAIHIGYVDVTLSLAFSDGAKGFGVPSAGGYVTFDAAAGSQNLSFLFESRSAFTPVSGATYSLAVEADRD